MTTRSIQEVRRAHASRDGDGVAIQRIAGMQHAGMDPILMIDELRSDDREDFGGGFPAHPHRGMQTLTYMKNGGIIHRDSQGNRGEIRSGGVQWMSAGRGIIHSEMPTADTRGLHGFQLWINLPRADKMGQPRYRDIPGEELVKTSGAGFDATVIAGCWQIDTESATGPLTELAPAASLADVLLAPGAAVSIGTPPQETALAYLYNGAIEYQDDQLAAQHLLISASGDSWTLQAGAAGAQFLLLRGVPLREPVAHYGPFVMNTPEEIERALQDYRSGQFAL